MHITSTHIHIVNALIAFSSLFPYLCGFLKTQKDKESSSIPSTSRDTKVKRQAILERQNFSIEFLLVLRARLFKGTPAYGQILFQDNEIQIALCLVDSF
jgi:hypothetical protein